MAGYCLPRMCYRVCFGKGSRLALLVFLYGLPAVAFSNTPATWVATDALTNTELGRFKIGDENTICITVDPLVDWTDADGSQVHSYTGFSGSMLTGNGISCKWNFYSGDGSGPSSYSRWVSSMGNPCPAGSVYDGIVTCVGPVLDPEKNKGLPSCPVSNPVNTATGGKYQSELDVRFSSALSPLRFVRAYNSGTAGAPALLGVRWTHNYAIRIDVISAGVNDIAYLRRPDGRVITFNRTGGNWAAAELDIKGELTSTPTGFRYTTESNSSEDYDSGGRLVSIVGSTGNTQSLSYDVQGQLDRVDTGIGEYLLFSYDLNTRMASITDHAGRTWGYRYDANNNLEYVDNPDATTRQYHYEDTNFPNALTGITDERGIRYATYGYDAQGRAILSTHAGNAQRVDISYNDTDGTRVVTNSLNQSSTYSTTVQLGVALVTDVSGPGCSTCGSGDAGYVYDPANNNLLSETESGITTRFGQYDSKGQYGCQVAGITAADTSTGECAFDPVASPDARRTDYTYDSRFFNKITSITEPSVFPGSSKVTTTTYDTFGNRLSETITGFDPAGNPVSRTTTRQYTGPLNQLSFVDGPRTDVNDFTTYRYYPNTTSQPIGTRARLKEIQNATGVLIRSNIQYTGTGKVLSESRPNGLSLTYTYYPGNDRLQTLTETGPGTTRVTRWTYLATGEVQTITTGDGTPDATTLGFGYDGARRLTRITDGLGNYIEYTLDTEGNRTFEKTFDAGDILKKQLAQTFDIYSRLNSTARANETTTPSFAADGTLDKTTDGNGAVTDYSYDALKRLTQVVQDQTGTGPTANTTSTYGYDVQDRLISVADPNTGNTTYSYDDSGNLLSQTSPDTGPTAFAYDAAGNLTQKTDAQGRLFTYTYDVLNRLIRLDAPGIDDDITYTYDSCLNGTGRLCSVTYGNGTVPTGNRLHYQYTPFGDVARHQGAGYGYDAQGRVQSIDYPSGARLTYVYDAAGQISQMDFTVNGQTRTLVNTLGYAPFGPITGLTYGNGLSLTRTLDTAYRLTAQTTPGVLERTYPQYDANGNRLSQTDPLASASTFSYDPLNRLDTAAGPFGTRDYDYDNNGNRTQLIADSVTTPLTYAPNSNRLATLGTTNVLLDATGNTLNQGNWSYSYTPHNRLATATETATLKASFAYNGLGQRTTKTDESAGTGRHYLYGLNGELLAETDQDGNLLTEYLYLNGTLLALFEPDDDQDGIPNQQEAKQGTLPLNTDSDGDSLSNLAEWFQYGTNSQSADSDGDGIADNVEIASHTDPNLPGSLVGDGDLNHDGQINLGDLVLLYQYVLGLRTIDADALTHGDMNLDGQLNTPDLLLLQKLLLQSFFNGGAPSSGAMVSNQHQGGWGNWLNRLIPPAYAFHSTNNGVLYYVHVDPLGAPQALTNEAGTKVWAAGYDPFGNATVDEDPDGDGNSVTLNVRFPGQYYDAETGLHYNYFRYYDPSTGRYITSDPIGLGGGLNTYAYVGGNPLTRIDPDGRRWVQCDTITNGECWVPDPPTDNSPDGKCVTAECAGGLLPAPLDLRPLDQITCESCMFTCQMSFIFGPGPVIPLSKLGLGKYLGEKGLQIFSCEKICEDDCKNCPVN